jgi:signal transduction histidine kinase
VSVTDPAQDRLERRVLVLAPTGRDAALARSTLGEAGIECHICPDPGSVAREIDRGAAAVLLAEEAIENGGELLAASIRRQPPWSDFPVLVLARQGADSEAVVQAIEVLGNVTVLERPIRIAALASAVRTALRARERQYRARAHLAEREVTAQALREADQRKDEFLATLAHELRNPLAPISNSLQILRHTQPGGPASHLYEMMERQVHYLVRMVDDLLEVSRISRGKIELKKEPVDLLAVIRAAIETSRPLVESHRHELVLDLPPPPLSVEADAVRLTQILANLLNNAAKYTPEGGRITLSARNVGGEAVIRVRDTGVGIPADLLPQIFDVFVQGDHPTVRSQGGGLGIGLTLVRRLVELHGGKVEAHSEGPGKGSEFVVRLPQETGSRVAARAAAQLASPVIHSPTRILVVDDNRDAADSLGTLLAVLGADVRVEHDGTAALDVFSAYRPKVVFLDVGMPGMDGYEVARRIRQQPASHDVTLVALTGWGQERDRRDSVAAGFDHHLTKPADIAALHALLMKRQ